MRFLTYIFLWFLTACSAAKQKDQSRKDSTVEQPTEVSGGFGLTMQCSILNREVEGATASEVGCVVNNDDGTKYTGSIKNLRASITAKGQTAPIQATPTVSDASSSLSVGVSVPGLKPGDAISIAINGVFDEKPATLTATLKGRFSVVCDEDFNLYVKVNAPATNLACTQEAPCAKISRAVQLLPDVFNCNVNVFLAPESKDPDAKKTFYDQILINGKQVTRRGSLSFIGTQYNFDTVPYGEDPPVILEPPTDLAPLRIPGRTDSYVNGILEAVNRPAVKVVSFGGGLGRVKLQLIKINGRSGYDSGSTMVRPGYFERGIELETSTVVLVKVFINNVSEQAIKATRSSQLLSHDVRINQTSIGINLEDSKAWSSSLLWISNAQEDNIREIKIDNEPPILRNFLPTSIQAQNGIQAVNSTFNSILRYTNAESSVRVPNHIYVRNFSIGISLTRESFVSIDTFARVSLDGNSYGIYSNNSKISWSSDISLISDLDDNNNPSLSLTNCKVTCVQLDSSDFIATGKRNAIRRPELRLSSAGNSTEANLISAYKRSLVRLEGLKNTWCDRSDHTLRIVQDSIFDYYRDTDSSEVFTSCFSEDPTKKTQKFNNFALSAPSNDNQCEVGYTLKDNVCYAQFGYGFVTTLSPLPVSYRAIPMNGDISDW